MASKFTPERQAIILEKLKRNPSLYSAAAAADITYPTLMRWLERGDDGEEGYAEFLREVEQARTKVKDEIVLSLYEIATDRLHPQAVKAAKELLSCLYPREFSIVRHSIVHKPSKDSEIDLSKLSTEELRAFHDMLKRVTKGDDSEHKAVPVLDVTSEG
jgi:hypothetical protein